MKTKLKLNDLKITSFVTELKQNETQTVNGGYGSGLSVNCSPYISILNILCAAEDKIQSEGCGGGIQPRIYDSVEGYLC